MSTDLDKVRQILLGPEFDELLQLKAELRDDEQFAELVGKVVTEALEKRNRRDNSVGDVIAPAIDQAISESINQDPRKMAESLYPIMGPAIRKSISETMNQMLENINELLEQSLSPQSMRWRFDAWRTGRSYSELVLLNTLEYQVDQVFMIHRETSLLIGHEASDLTDSRDPDMVSSMLSAIQDFIKDSFATVDGDELDTLRLGELSVVVARGPQAVIAAVVRGKMPEDLRQKMHTSLERLHREKRKDLTDFSGDTEAFEDTSEDLQSLLAMERKKPVEEESKPPWLAIAAISIILLAMGYFSYEEYKWSHHVKAQVATLNAEPGIVVLDRSEEGNETVLTLLKDALATDPETLMVFKEGIDFEPRFITYPHLSTDDVILERRANAVLTPLDETRLQVTSGQLVLSGQATKQWLNEVAPKLNLIAGINSSDLSQLTVYDPIESAIITHRNNIESREFDFAQGDAELDQASSLQKITDSIKALNTLKDGAQVQIDIIGYTDSTGSARVNRRIGLSRADTVRDALIALGINPRQLRSHYGPEYDSDSESVTQARKTRLKVNLR